MHRKPTDVLRSHPIDGIIPRDASPAHEQTSRSLRHAMMARTNSLFFFLFGDNVQRNHEKNDAFTISAHCERESVDENRKRTISRHEHFPTSEVPPTRIRTIRRPSPLPLPPPKIKTSHGYRTGMARRTRRTCHPGQDQEKDLSLFLSLSLSLSHPHSKGKIQKKKKRRKREREGAARESPSRYIFSIFTYRINVHNPTAQRAEKKKKKMTMIYVVYTTVPKETFFFRSFLFSFRAFFAEARCFFLFGFGLGCTMLRVIRLLGL